MTLLINYYFNNVLCYMQYNVVKIMPYMIYGFGLKGINQLSQIYKCTQSLIYAIYR